MTDQTDRLLRDAENYLSALHGSVARHDNLAANYGCAGCELRDQIREAMAAPVSSAGPAPADRDTRERIVQVLRTTPSALGAENPQLGFPSHHQPGESGYLGWCALCVRDIDAIADAVVAVLPAPADRAAVLSPIERRMLEYALNLADAEIEHDDHGISDDEQDALAALRRLAGEAQQDEHACGNCEGVDPASCLANPARAREAQQDEPVVTTADKAEALGMTPTEYRDESHRLGEQKIREAARWLRADVAFRVLDALDGAQRPAREAPQDPTQDGTFVPPAAEGLPLAALDSARNGATMIDAFAETPNGRNFLAHALVQLARDGWLRTEPGEGFEPVRDRDDVPEPQEPASVARPGQPETDNEPADTVQQPKEAENPRSVCVCGHTRGEHVIVGGPFGHGRLLCDVCNGLEGNACKEFEAL